MKTLTKKPELSKNEYDKFAHKILWYIGKGRKNAIHLRELCYKLGLSANDGDERKVRLAIKELGKIYPILSCDDGYFWCETKEELDEFVAYHVTEIRSRCYMLRDTKKICKEYIGKSIQIPLI